MQKLKSILLFLAFAQSSTATFMVYPESLQKFVDSRDLVVRGVVTRWEPTQGKTIRTYQDEDEEFPVTGMRTEIKILEVLKNESKAEKFEKDKTIVLRTYHCEIILAGTPVVELGTEGFWILDTSEENYGFDTGRSLQGLNYEAEIKEAINKEKHIQSLHTTPASAPR